MSDGRSVSNKSSAFLNVVHHVQCGRALHGIKMLQNKNTDAKKMLKNKFTRKAESDDDESDEGVEEEYCSDATYLARQIASAERLCQAESTVITLKEILFDKKL